MKYFQHLVCTEDAHHPRKTCDALDGTEWKFGAREVYNLHTSALIRFDCVFSRQSVHHHSSSDSQLCRYPLLLKDHFPPLPAVNYDLLAYYVFTGWVCDTATGEG